MDDIVYITPEALSMFLSEHQPSIDNRLHFVCQCGWHETFAGVTDPNAPLPEEYSWWAEYIQHLTAPVADSPKEIN